MTSQVYEPKGYRFEYLPAEEFANLAAHLDDSTRMVWIETPSNPMLKIVDIAAVAEAAHAAGAMLVVDNTFATPYLQRPLELGADVVVHSTTKYLGGHSDVVGGFAATNDPTVAERLASSRSRSARCPARSTAGSCCAGSRRSRVRMRQHCQNAIGGRRGARAAHAGRARLLPGPADHPGHAIAAQQMRDFGGMVSFLAESPEEAAAHRRRARRSSSSPSRSAASRA